MMKNPVHPGTLVKANLAELRLSIAKAAKALKVTRQHLNNVVSGKSAVSPEMALRLEKAFGGSAEMWVRMQVAHDLAKLRLRGRRIDVARLAALDQPR
jgi:addiction module HigA family antidote